MEFSTEVVAKVAAFLEPELRAWVQDHAEASELDLETALRQGMQQIGGACLRAAVEMEVPRYPKAAMACGCGGQAQYQFQREAKLLTVFGWVSYQRPYYLCSQCHQGQAPLDRRWGLRPGQVSAGLAHLLALEGIDVSFEEASRKVAETLLVQVSENTIRQVTQRFGALQEEAESQWQSESQDTDNLIARRRTVTHPPRRLYGAMDGVIFPTKSDWRELKCLCWFEVEAAQRGAQRAVGDTSDLRAKNIHYYCDVADAATFRDLVWATGYRHDADRASEIVFVSDGAPWIWKIVEYHFPQAKQIVDWYHAAQYLSAICTAVFGEGSTEGTTWLERARSQLWDGQITQVITTCEEQERKPGAADAVHRAVTYYTNNRQRIDYARFRAEGYQIGSGTVESACKQLATGRLRRAGARWNEPGARHTAKARAAWLSHDWEPLKARYAALA
jgi:hypothetical protein